ncbi:hypothetical protein N7462_004739 [Penicillium macrosclerotiorum]|uniref:uncharacterized protein n=1 Tax=Penicillium macrosclerotiorum TaxID=303699 RepID=UPI0025468ED5|nr:uncharacterized protein N7462_004739 [Penicillium macrosclerotiorum]KAJ5690347.1 hypothetical protein N7462_004739 [Penicillium macrosclerotiorum]
MAIWPFGRKSKRHTIQVSADEANVLQQALEHDPPAFPEPTLGRKPSRRASKRQSNKRLSRSGDGSDSAQGSGPASSHRPISSLDHRRLSEAERDRADPDQVPRPLSRTESLLKKHRQNQSQNQNGPNKLRKSKRQTNEILREREIRMLSSTPIDIPGRSVGVGDYVVEHRRRRANGRRADRYLSDISLSIRDSAASSMSDISDPYTYKVNAFAALTPRPVVRYVETRRLQTPRGQNASMGSGRPDRNMQEAEEDLYYSRRRVNELADSLDASTLRELLDRDRRRREKKQIDDQEHLRRKLQERADAQQAEENIQAADETVEPPQAQPEAAPVVAQVTDEPEPMDDIAEENQPEEQAPTSAAPKEQAGSWLQVETGDGEPMERESLESAHVIGNIDDGSIRGRKLAARPSFAPSLEMGMSRTTLSPSHSSLRHGLNSPSQSQTFGMGSTSDLSERRPSDTSGRRPNTITSLFRRGSSRIKRRYKERFQDSSPEVSNASHESFYKIQTQSSPPAPSVIIPPRTFIPTGTINRPQSKFTEHFGDEPLSPPDSRLQSPDTPDIPEQVPESSLEHEEGTFLHDRAPSTGIDIVNPRRRRHQSWGDGFDAESDNLPLSQSLASIDSEGSWMSGQIFRRMSQKKPGSPVRSNLAPFGAASIDGPVEEHDEHDETRDSVDSHGATSNVVGEPELDNESTGNDASKPAETWHGEVVGRRPVLVNPVSRPKSGQAILKNITTLSPIAGEEDYITVDETDPPAPHRVASMHGVISHVEQD